MALFIRVSLDEWEGLMSLLLSSNIRPTHMHYYTCSYPFVYVGKNGSKLYYQCMYNLPYGRKAISAADVLSNGIEYYLFDLLLEG